MPTSAKQPKKPHKPAQEMFYLDDDHERQDADFHNPILDGGNHAAAEQTSLAVMKRAGLTPKQIAALTKGQS
jgi:hypothetical protein